MRNFICLCLVASACLLGSFQPAYARMNGVEYLIRQQQDADKKSSPKQPKPAEEEAVVAKEDDAVASPPKKTVKKTSKSAPKKTASKTDKKTAKKAAKVSPQQKKASGGGSPSARSGATPETQMGGDGGSVVAPTIIIDPGHGGKDPGAISKSKIREKDVVLAISRQLAAALRKKLGAKVYLTRGNDTFITLDNRNRIANRRQADIFLSIHGNASTSKKAEGIEIYYLNKATDAASEKLAARENAGAPKEEAALAAIVSDLLQTAATEESAELAKRVKGALQRRLQKKYKIQDVTVKTALFYVLVGAKCPSLLIETGFVTHPKEGKRLTKIAFQKDMANAIAEAVTVYWKTAAEAGDDL